MTAGFRWRRVVAIGFLVILATWVFAFRASKRMPDFEVYARAGARAAAAEPLYRVDDNDYQFKYFPAFAILTMPLAAVPAPVAKAIWFASSVLVLIVLLRLSVKLLPDQRRTSSLLIMVAVIALGRFYAEELVIGQINLWLTLVVVLAALAAQSGRDVLAGALTALAIVIKPYALILVLWVAARRNLRTALALVVGVVIALLLPALVYGLDGSLALHMDWWHTVTRTTAGVMVSTDNISVPAMFARAFESARTATWLAAATSAALLALSGLMLWRRRGVPAPDGLEIALLLTLTPLLSPQGWDYVLVVATPAMIFLANYDRALARPHRVVTIIAVALIGLTFYDLVGRTAHRALMRMSILPLCFLVVISALAALRFRKAA